jgi:hypothetical protein
LLERPSSAKSGRKEDASRSREPLPFKLPTETRNEGNNQTFDVQNDAHARKTMDILRALIGAANRRFRNTF